MAVRDECNDIITQAKTTLYRDKLQYADNKRIFQTVISLSGKPAPSYPDHDSLSECANTFSAYFNDKITEMRTKLHGANNQCHTPLRETRRFLTPIVTFDVTCVSEIELLIAKTSKAGHRSNLASLRFRVNATTERRSTHRSTFCGLLGAFEQSLFPINWEHLDASVFTSMLPATKRKSRTCATQATDWNVRSTCGRLKTCQLDPMPSNHVKDNIISLASVITNITNASLSEGVMPNQLKHAALVHPRLKKPSLCRNTLNNYRPVSNIPQLSKIIEKVIANRPNAHLCRHFPVSLQTKSFNRDSAIVCCQ